VKFFFDGSFPKRLCLAIRVLEHGNPGIEIVFKHDKFAPNVDDTVWIGALATEGDWVVVTMDPRYCGSRMSGRRGTRPG
jgi:PIN like domain